MNFYSGYAVAVVTTVMILQSPSVRIFSILKLIREFFAGISNFQGLLGHIV